MSKTLHPISTWTRFEWRKVGEIWVKWRNCLKIDKRGRWSPIENCSLLKYIALWGCFLEDRASSFTRWIEILSGIWKRARNSCSDRRSIGHSDIRRPTLVFLWLPFWTLPPPLVKATLSLADMLNSPGPCGNLCRTTQIIRVSHPTHPPLGTTSIIQQGT